jgi:hypothetical protein
MEITTTTLSNQPLTVPNNINQLVTSLQIIAPQNSETTKLITYVLVGTVIAGLFVYHYIKNQENL